MQGGDKMKNKNFSGDTTTPSGSSREILDKAARRDPRITGMLSKLSEDDRSRLMEVLNDPEQARSILATPQAQALIRSLQRQNGQPGGPNRSDGE